MRTITFELHPITSTSPRINACNHICQVLKCRTLCIQNSNLYYWKTMIKTMCLEVFKANSKLYVNVKFESSVKQKAVWLLAWLDRSKLRLDRSKLGRSLFCRIFQLSPICFKTFLGFFICPKYKRQTLATFQCCSYCGLCKSLVRSRGAFLYTNLGFSRRRYFLHLDDQFSCCH